MTIRILSAGAPNVGVTRCVTAFQNDTGESVEVTFSTAPMILEKVGAGAAEAELVVAPVNTMDQFLRAGLVAPETVSVIGSVKAAVVVREGTTAPDLSSAASLKQAILAAGSLVYNSASSGQYIETLIFDMGIADAVAAKTTRPDTGAAVIDHLVDAEDGSAIGFGQQTEILRHIDLGQPVKLAGTLPAEVENLTSYMAAVLSDAANNQEAQALAAFMGSVAGLKIFKSAGVT